MKKNVWVAEVHLLSFSFSEVHVEQARHVIALSRLFLLTCYHSRVRQAVTNVHTN